MSTVPRSPLRSVALVLAVTVVLSAVLTAVQVPSPVLFAAVLGGMAHALTSPTPLALPGWGVLVAQGLIGITVGALVDLATLRRLGTEAVPVVLVVVGTLVLSIGAGRVLALRRDVSPTTGVFSLVAGGASGVVAVARDLGADDRVVTVVQYLRVLVVLLTMPVVTALVFHPPSGGGTPGSTDAGLPADLTFVAVSLAAGLLLARVVPVSTMSLLGPLLVSSVLAAGGWLGAVSVPTALEWLAFALIGVQVGLRFTRASLHSIARMLPVVLALIAVVVVGTAGLGEVLTWLTPADPLTAYLATTPGGLFAVLAIASDSGADATYVMAVQLLRLLVILAILPLLARWLRRPGD
ncbi:AbrB family transcriptional regulator [Nocardioides sp. AX2bis]|uniref:AbrB family transcriptional regulator n=1 Tax=Nocardioides sp. AX2bis TaxID=2653157 RepID=UPI0012F340FB|nr:AbrB family transcriptional regulator [Nocardioides sp. AX2bis]VXB47988.1 putative regulator AbrB [Nocardioides sp. AX2bis]